MDRAGKETTWARGRRDDCGVDLAARYVLFSYPFLLY
jgi:hypothetical protein